MLESANAQDGKGIDERQERNTSKHCASNDANDKMKRVHHRLSNDAMPSSRHRESINSTGLCHRNVVHRQQNGVALDSAHLVNVELRYLSSTLNEAIYTRSCNPIVRRACQSFARDVCFQSRPMTRSIFLSDVERDSKSLMILLRLFRNIIEK